eukprot:c29593_g1_i1 orf=362-757(-)
MSPSTACLSAPLSPGDSRICWSQLPQSCAPHSAVSLRWRPLKELNISIQFPLATKFHIGEPDSKSFTRLAARAGQKDGGTDTGEDYRENDTLNVAGTVQRIEVAVRIFMSALVWVFLFFVASVWRGKDRKG